MKLRSSSSGCEAGPAKRRHASVWAVGYASKTMSFRVPRVSCDLKATAVFPRVGEGRSAPGGVSDHGTQEEDGPGTWEALAFLDSFRSDGESGDPSPTSVRMRTAYWR